MLTEQDLLALSAMIDTKLQSQRQDIIAQVASAMNEQNEIISNIIKASETRINIKIENEVSKEIRSLFDGYKTVREAQ